MDAADSKLGTSVAVQPGMSRLCRLTLFAALLLPAVGRAEEPAAKHRDPMLSMPELQQLAAFFNEGRPRLEYRLQGAQLSVALEPGAPCTGACLTLAGWF